MKLSTKSFVFAAAVAFAAQITAAAVITQWNFNQPAATPVPAPFPASTGVGNATLVGGTTATLASGVANGGSSDPVNTSPPNYGWNVTTFAAQGQQNKERGAQFSTSTVGFQDIVVSYDLRHSNTSSRFEQVQYTIDGSNFIDIAVFDGPAGDTWFNGRTVNLSSIPGVNDNPNFAIRVVAVFAPDTSAYAPSNATSTYAASGTWRFDMVTVSGNVIPEPAALGLLAPAALLLGRRRK